MLCTDAPPPVNTHGLVVLRDTAVNARHNKLDSRAISLHSFVGQVSMPVQT